MPLSLSPDDLGLTAADAATGSGTFSLLGLGLDRDSHNMERFNASIVAPDNDADRTPRAILAYIDRVLSIVDPVRAPTTRPQRPSPGPDAAPTVRIQPHGLPVATGTPRDVLAYIDAELTRVDTNAATAARNRANDAATVIRGVGYAIGATTATNIPGIIGDTERIQRLINDIRADITARADRSAHARAPYTRSIRTAARTLIGRYGLTADEIVARLNDAD